LCPSGFARKSGALTELRDVTVLNIAGFFEQLVAVHGQGNATEHSYRAALQSLFDSINPAVTSQNEPQRLRDVGAPDFSFHRGDVVIGHAEAKIPGADIKKLTGREKDQFNRYRNALPNLIYTDGLLFLFFRDGELINEVRIGEVLMGLQPDPDQFEALEHALADFALQTPRTITSPEVLARHMAGKAVLVKDILGRSLIADKGEKTELADQYQAFKDQLIHDITVDDFAGMYAETIAYGMFAARLHDDTLDTFSRHEALDLLPKSNPFLRNLFGYIAGPNLDDRIRWIIDDLANVFRSCDVAQIMEGFGQLTGRNDPFLHFYETFLAAYDPKKRKARGVWYTPEPVVNFIVRAVDEVLQTEFGLPMGLADTSKVTIDWETGQTGKKGKRETIKKEVHRVQILDPATGTGTFLAEVIKQIAPRIKNVAPGGWNSYVEKELIPRLHGFELLMASYAMCHMKLEMMLHEMGYTPTKEPPRLSVYLTNSLEEGEPADHSLPFAQWLSREAREANTIKRDMPIMCVIGNPPYLGEGGKPEGWIGELMEDYKKEPGGKVKLKERNPKWINDLYVQFIRMSEHLIEKNGEGVLGFITNHGYLDNPTFRGMRWHLLKTFDKIYVLDLHGNAKKKEVAPDGSPDKNVFDIQQGVAIVIAVKSGEKKAGLAEVMQGDLWGPRAEKYEVLRTATFSEPLFAPLESPAPHHPLVRRDVAAQDAYEAGFSIATLMPTNSVGIVTARDSLTIDHSRDNLWQRVQNFAALDTEEAREKYKLGKDVRDWQVAWAQEDLNKDLTRAKLARIAYRPLDTHWTYYTGSSRGFMCYPRSGVMRHMLAGNNFSLLTSKAHRDQKFAHVLVSTTINEVIGLSPRTASNSITFPLYLYPEDQDLDQARRVNFDPKLYTRLQKLATHPDHGTPDEVAVFDYIYGVLHCPAYRETFAEFLKIDFPRIPWPTSPDVFWDVSAKGTALRRLHLMEPEAIGDTPYPFEGEGDAMVDKVAWKDGMVMINKTQGFAGVSQLAWEFYIGGYQPAQKWLKDRKGRELSFDDLQHYQRIIKILSETDRIMKTIEMDLS
jgi:hypothetical protein